MCTGNKLSYAAFAFLVVSHIGFSAEHGSLDTIEVTAAPAGYLNPNSLDEIEYQLENTPGGTNLITFNNKPSVVTLSDALGNQPGVVVQEFFGGLDQPRLNIRGSGLQANPVSRGVLLRENNLPINEADGSFIIGTLDLKSTQAIAIHRGANSRVPGALTLGGDINFISITEPQSQDVIQAETGSFSQSAFLFDHMRSYTKGFYRLGFSEASADGFRNHSASNSTIYRASGGFSIGNNIVNHSHFRHTKLHFDMPFVLAEKRAEKDPQSVYGDGNELFDIGLNMYARDPHRSVQQFRITNQTTIHLNNNEHSVGLYWQTTDDAFVDPMSHIETDSKLNGIQYIWDYYPTHYFHIQLGLDHNQSDMPREYFGNHPLNGSKLGNYASFDLMAKNTTGSLVFNLTLFPEWTLNSQIQWSKATRTATKQQDNSKLNESWHLTTPKLGIIYQPALTPLRIFANLSQSTEIPTYWEFIGTSLNPVLTYLSEAFFLELEPQKATTFEIGGQYKFLENKLDVTFYRTKIAKELMSTASQYGVIANTQNYDGDTIHQGVEFGFSGQTMSALGSFLYQTTWNYSDFYFSNGVFQGNQIAGIPKHIISGEILYQSQRGLVGPTVTWVPGSNPADHRNTLDHQGYLIWGLKALFKIKPFLKAHLAINNLTDERYNSTYVIRKQSNPELPTFLPGNGLSIQAGISLQLQH